MTIYPPANGGTVVTTCDFPTLSGANQFSNGTCTGLYLFFNGLPPGDNPYTIDVVLDGSPDAANQFHYPSQTVNFDTGFTPTIDHEWTADDLANGVAVEATVTGTNFHQTLSTKVSC